MKSPLPLLTRFILCLATVSLVSCSTSSLVSSRTRHVGTIHAIKECRADANRAYVLFQMEKDGPWETCVVELKTRNAAVGRKAPASAQALKIIELPEETAAVPKGRSSPCLGVWRVHPDKPGSPLVPRVRWVGAGRDFCVNLPCKAADPGRIVSRVPMAIAQDALFVGAIVPLSVGLSFTGGMYGAPTPIASSIGDWAAGEFSPGLP
jgi:hypothetical protein